MQELRDACAEVGRRASHVGIVEAAIAPYAAALPEPEPLGADAPVTDREAGAAFWIQYDAVNFGSGWFPTLRKLPGLSGSRTILAGFAARAGPWTAEELTGLTASGLARTLGQAADHPLMALYAASLNDLGRRVINLHGGAFAGVVDAAGGSAVGLARHLGAWACFSDHSRYHELTLPFLKRAQILAADLHRAGVAAFGDVDELTMFADNLVPHVLRLDGVLWFAPELVARIEAQQLIEPGSPEEVEMRACAVEAVERIVAARGATAPAAAIDHLLWHRGQQPRYKVVPRPRCRCTAY
jgi:hypothetical protein